MTNRFSKVFVVVVNIFSVYRYNILLIYIDILFYPSLLLVHDGCGKLELINVKYGKPKSDITDLLDISIKQSDYC